MNVLVKNFISTDTVPTQQVGKPCFPNLIIVYTFNVTPFVKHNLSADSKFIGIPIQQETSASTATLT